MAATLRSSIIIPENFAQYVYEQTILRDTLLQSGIAKPLADFQNFPGDYVSLPFWQDLQGADEVLSETVGLTPDGITASRQRGVVLHRGRGWKAGDLAKLASGDDPVAAIGIRIANYIANRRQQAAIQALNGAFGAVGTINTGAALINLSIDATGSGETAISPRHVAYARALMDQNGPDLTGMIIHPAVFADLEERRMIEYVTATDARVTASTIAAGSITSINAFGGTVAPSYQQDAKIPYYGGLRVIVSSDVPTSGSGSSTKYAVYFFKDGALLYGDQAPQNVETDRDIMAKASGISADWHPVYHPNGLAWAGGANPTNAQLATIGNWTLVQSVQNVGIVRATVVSNFD
jgi:hypothetical protein